MSTTSAVKEQRQSPTDAQPTRCHPNPRDATCSSERHGGADEGKVSASVQERIRLTLLLACLGTVMIVFLATRTSVLQGAAGHAAVAYAGTCTAVEPSVANVGVWQLAELRAGLAVLSGPLRGRPYAEGTVRSENAWTDNEPGPVGSRSTNASLGAGYELRWWARNGDDMVADVFVFPGEREAQDFLRLATDARCRRDAVEAGATSPPGARNLRWVNPDDVSEDDAYMQRGRRVYRIADVLPQRTGKPPGDGRQRAALRLVDIIACVMPGAECRLGTHRPAPGSGTRALSV